MNFMKERRIRDFLAGLFEGRGEDPPLPATREVPTLSERQVAFHTGMRSSGAFTVEKAAKLYQKRREHK